MNIGSERIDKVLTEYLGFYPRELIDGTDYAYIFGGALRDAIVGDPINDIDILCLPNSYKTLCNTLELKGFNRFEMSTMNISCMYSELEIIFKPVTYIKGDKIVQLIRPKVYNLENVFQKFFKLLTNVDISCCGLYLDGHQIKECYNDALMHILCKVYSINKDALMYNENRIDERVSKLESRGWRNLSHVSEDELKERQDSLVKMLYRESGLDELLTENKEK